MNVPGDFDVGASGAATYSIPIMVPPGTAGMEPALTLQYSSQGGNGALGPGWSLSGLPSIERCARTYEQDSPVKGSVAYNMNDRFCLNGERLVAITGTYGSSGTEYRTEIENFSRIISYDATASGPQWFRVWTKSGQIMEFGNTSDSRFMSGSAVHSWHVNRIADTAGNYMTVAYTHDTTNRQIYPSRIDYTGNTGLIPYNSVRFEYNTNRPDQVPLYHHNSMKRTVLLTAIKTYYEGNNLVHDYRLAYELGNTLRPSRLTSVTLCNGVGGCLPPTSFTWPNYNDPLVFTQSSWDPQAFVGAGAFIGEFNGDGLPDFLGKITHLDWNASTAIAYYWMSTSPGNWRSESWPVDHTMPPIYGGGESYLSMEDFAITPWPTDFNGDGYTDAIIDDQGSYRDSNNVITSYYGPARRSSNVNNKTGRLDLAFSGGTSAQGRPWGDIDGDGRDDQLVLYAAPNGAKPFISNGDGSVTEGAAIPGVYANSTVLPGDFDGNGCIDGLGQGGTSKIIFSCGPAVSEVGVTNWISQNKKLILADYNGDGKTDVLVTDSSAATQLWLSTGISLVQVATYTGPSGWADFAMLAGDFNGDGRADLARVDTSNSYTKIYLSTGNDFVETTSITESNGSGTFQTAEVQDFNGDGAADLWIRRSGTSTLYTTTYNPMLITAIHDGLTAPTGQKTDITYDRLNKGNGVYTKGNSAVYPEMDVTGGQYVVSKAETPDGIGGKNTFTYQYNGAKFRHRGRGFLGFRQRIVTQWRTTDPNQASAENFVHTTTYRQDYPYIGRIDKETTVRNGVELRSTQNAYDAVSFTGTGGDGRFVKLIQSIVQTRDLDGTAFPTVTTNYTAYDSYGNPTAITVVGSGGDTKTTTNVYDNTVDATRWLLGRLRTTTTVHALTNQPNVTRKAAFVYDPNTGLLTQEQIEPDIASLRLTTVYGRDPTFGNITTTTVSGTDITTRVTTDSYANDSKKRFITSTTNAENKTSSFTNSPRFGGLTQHTDPNGLVSSIEYDDFGRPKKIIDPDSRYRDISYTYCIGIAGGSASCPTYGVQQVEVVPRRAGGTAQSGPRTITFYDRLGRVVAEDVEGTSGAWIRTAYEYDTFGRLSRSTYPFFRIVGTAYFTTYSYDALDRVVAETYPNSTSTKTRFTYSGLTTTTINDPNNLNRTTLTTLNDQLQIYRVTEAGNTTTEYAYTAAGDLREIKDPAGYSITHVVDTRGRVMQSQDPSRGTWNYQYTVLDQLKRQTDAMNRATTLAYDRLGRVTQVAAPDLTSTFVYDTATKGVGQLAEMYTGSQASPTSRRVHTYDTLGRPETTTIYVDGSPSTFTSTYDLDGRLATVTYPSTFTARYEYTNNQRYLSTLRDNSTNALLWRADSRDAELRYTQATLGNNVQVNRGFNPSTRRLNTVQAGPGNIVANLGFSYDAVGNLTDRADFRLGGAEHFEYDSLNRLKSAAVGATTRSVTYDARGNILTKTRLGSTLNNTYTYPAAGQPKPYAVSSIAGAVNGFADPTFTYDAHGNMLTGAGRTITWTAFDKVATITPQGGTPISYVYDAARQRLKQTSGSTTVAYYNDPASGVSAERNTVSGVSTWHDYLFADGQRIGVRKSSGGTPTWQYYVHDHQNSVAVVTNSDGTVAQYLAYDAWGRRRNPNTSEDPTGALTGPTTRGYTDHEHIEAVDLINMNGRVYDPELGRFMSADPIIPDVFRTQALNRYSYVYNNPASMVDPSGYDGESIFGPVTGNPFVDIAAGIFLNTLFNKIFSSDADAPPRHHKPGLGSVTENWRGYVPLVDVSAPITSGIIPTYSVAQASTSGGSTDLGGAKYMNGADSSAFDYTEGNTDNAAQAGVAGVAIVAGVALRVRIGAIVILVGGGTTQLDSPLPGPADIVGGVLIGIGVLIGGDAAIDSAWNTVINASDAPAPGRPTGADGYDPPRVTPRNADKDGRVPNPNGSGKGWPDSKGDVWVPTGGKGAHGGEHWDVQTPGRGGAKGRHRNVYPGGRVR